MKNGMRIGARFGHLVVIKRLELKTNSVNSKWLWRCDCGNEVVGSKRDMVTIRNHRGMPAFCGELERHPGIKSEDKDGNAPQIPGIGDTVWVSPWKTGIGVISCTGTVINVYDHSICLNSDDLPAEAHGRMVVPLAHVHIEKRANGGHTNAPVKPSFNQGMSEGVTAWQRKKQRELAEYNKKARAKA